MSASLLAQLDASRDSTTLSLAYASFGDEGCNAVARFIRENTALRTLDLRGFSSSWCVVCSVRGVCVCVQCFCCSCFVVIQSCVAAEEVWVWLLLVSRVSYQSKGSWWVRENEVSCVCLTSLVCRLAHVGCVACVSCGRQ